MNSLLKIENEQGSPIPEFFGHGRNHHQPEAHWVLCNDEKNSLPRQSYGNETIVEAGMSNHWRVLPPDRIKHEIKRRENQNAPDPGNTENYLGEFHLAALEAVFKIQYSGVYIGSVSDMAMLQ